jgi:putative transposase
MPGRKTPLITDSIYHIFNRGVASMPIFLDERHYWRCLDTLLYYQEESPKIRFSYFSRQQFLDKDKKPNKPKQHLVKIISYCFMPNHFHLLLEQSVDNGISNFMSKFANSYTRYFNTKNKRIGPIFQGKFKSVLVETESQLLHLSRYIHLNPYSAGLAENINQLDKYQYSSLPEYLHLTNTNYCQKDIVLSYFKQKNSYRNFVYDHADHQRNLQNIKKVMLDFEE